MYEAGKHYVTETYGCDDLGERVVLYRIVRCTCAGVFTGFAPLVPDEVYADQRKALERAEELNGTEA
ncbi:MAG: hypothetical protein LUC24_00620 [Bacteroidales bacterium]|nr:hypothetical protein [Bacteroidales bacterium]